MENNPAKGGRNEVIWIRRKPRKCKAIGKEEKRSNIWNVKTSRNEKVGSRNGS